MERPTVQGRPEALAKSVEDLVHRVRTGQVRIPDFQRKLRWKSSDVVKLFDSLYRGYPVGSLLIWKREAKAETVHLGPLKIRTPELPEAWWVVDGQQRLVALAASFDRGRARDLNETYSVFFDPKERAFHGLPRNGEITDLWVPIYELLDASRLSEWIFDWPHRQQTELRKEVFEAGRRLREYQIPLYLIESERPESLREIFYRVNTSGFPLKWEEVHDALFGSSEDAPSTLEDLAADLRELGMGELELRRWGSCLVAIRGGDTTRSFRETFSQKPDLLQGAVKDGLPVLRRVLSFLRRDAEIPHLRLLPQSYPLEILARFFALHPNPSPRSRLLLSRWLWRGFLAPSPLAEATLRRRGVAVVEADEELSVQKLLQLGPREPTSSPLPQAFDARESRSRVVLVALSRLRPRHLVSGDVLDLAEEIQEHDTRFFAHLISRRRLAAAPELYGHPANRLLHPPIGDLLQKVRDAGRGASAQDPPAPVLASHALSEDALSALQREDWAEVIRCRARALEEEARRLEQAKAAWDHSDRPSMEYLLRDLGLEGDFAEA